MGETKKYTTQRQIDKCHFSYKGISRCFVEIMYSIEAVKIEVSFTSLNESSPQRSIFEMLEPSLLKIFSSILLLKNVSLLFEKLGKCRR